MKEQIKELIIRLEELLGNFPAPVAKPTKEKIQMLREMLIEQRPPRFALVGRRGSGKSSLINAFFGEKVAELGHDKAKTGAATWWTYKGGLGSLEILDTRGFQEGSKPDQPDDCATPLESIQKAIQLKAPDTLLFLAKAKEADAAIDVDLEALQQVCETVQKSHGFCPPIVVVVTHCDELEPKNIKLHAQSDEDEQEYAEKYKRVSLIEEMLRKKLRNINLLKDNLVNVIGISSYQSWKLDNAKRADERWRIDELIKFLSDELPKEAKVELARISRIKKLQEEISTTITHCVAGINAGLAAVPIPIADIGPITSLQVSLVAGIAYISGRKFSIEVAGEFVVALGANVGLSFVFREIARGLVKILLPGGGSVISAAVAYAGTCGIGKTAIAHYIYGHPREKLKDLYQKIKKESPPPQN